MSGQVRFDSIHSLACAEALPLSIPFTGSSHDTKQSHPQTGSRTHAGRHEYCTNYLIDTNLIQTPLDICIVLHYIE
jgi:hypothetical protein